MFDWDMVYLIEQLIERQHAEAGLHTLHASAVELNGKSVIFAGSSGAGKSVLAAYGITQGYRFSGGEKVLVNSCRIAAGSQLLCVGAAPAARFLPHGKPIYQVYEKIPTSKISAIVFPKIFNGKGFRRDLDDITGRFRLSEVIDEKLRGDFLVSMQTISAQSIDTATTRESRRKLLNKLSKKVAFIAIEGNLKYIYKEVEKLI